MLQIIAAQSADLRHPATTPRLLAQAVAPAPMAVALTFPPLNGPSAQSIIVINTGLADPITLAATVPAATVAPRILLAVALARATAHKIQAQIRGRKMAETGKKKCKNYLFKAK